MDAALIERDAEGRDLVQYDERDPIHGTRRDESGRPRNASVYPLRDLSGIQFFFPNQVRLGLGHLVYPRSKWGLTSISQVAHWRTRLSPRGAYLGQVSVDIGDFYEQHAVTHDRVKYLERTEPSVRSELAKPKTAWRCEWWEIPVRTWDQIVETLEPAHAASLEPPRYYHLDQGLVLVRSEVATLYRVGVAGRQYFPLHLARNETPFLINLPGQWERRPGLAGVLESSHGMTVRPFDPWYRISNGRWVLAGTYMASHTRMMTMEACNESARHAVNAILHELLICPEPGKYDSQGKLLGEMCAIYDPFEHEVDDFEPLKQLDQALFDEGLPHFVEILGIERLLAPAARSEGRKEAVEHLTRVLESTQRAQADAWGFLTKDLERNLAPLREHLVRRTKEGLDALKRSEPFAELALAVRDLVREVSERES
jgi:hypothetical protein